MQADTKWIELGWRHPLWNLLRFYLSIRGKKKQAEFKRELFDHANIELEQAGNIPVPADAVELFVEYMKHREDMFEYAMNQLRTEDEARKFCLQKNLNVGVTKTRSNDHHQASKSLIAAVSEIAEDLCQNLNFSIDKDPQKRCVWWHDNELHVTARNLDGAVPGLINPVIIWEIKEYWGKTKGGSKMSDAVYECQLVGLELLDYEERANQKIYHTVFLDGKDQWGYRKSDLKRFIDLLNQGLIDYLFIGREVESDWANVLSDVLSKNLSV